MKTIITILIIVGIVFLLGALKFLMELLKPGVYPPKKVLRKRTAALAGAGGIFLIIALLLGRF
nr:hypothetical protein [Neobacillus sp. Marseille-Q6967]